MRLINADKLSPDCITNKGTLAISQGQIANAPTVEERPQGEWIVEDLGFYVYCFECNVLAKIRTKFCPNCGADMRNKV